MGRAKYEEWLARGKPFTLVGSLMEMRDQLRAVGYTVYDIGNLDHMLHDPPEDHTPYSATGWPIGSRYGFGYAIDIMPNGALPSLPLLGAWIFEDKQAGKIPWLKYMNWEPGDGNCWHESWQPNYIRIRSTDRGHIHISGRTDLTNPIGYNPLWRIVDMDATQDMRLRQVHAIVRMLLWKWNPTRAQFVDPDGAGGDSRVFDFEGGLGDNPNRVAQSLADIEDALSGIGGLTTADREAIQALTVAVTDLNNRLASP